MKIIITNKISKTLMDDKTIKKNYGKLSKNIIVCLSVLYSVDNLLQVPNVPPTRRHKLTNGNWAIDLSSNWRLIIRPINASELKEIETIEILQIEDYH